MYILINTSMTVNGRECCLILVFCNDENRQVNSDSRNRAILVGGPSEAITCQSGHVHTVLQWWYVRS